MEGRQDASPDARFGGAGPFDAGPEADSDILAFDDRPTEVDNFRNIASALGFRTQVLDRFSEIGDNLAAMNGKTREPPKLMVVDLWWEMKYDNYALLGRKDVKVPKQQHLRGLVMLSEVLTHEPALREVPTILLSSFLHEYDDDYHQGLEKMRRRGTRVDSIAKRDLQERGGLERVASVMEGIGFELPPAIDADLPSPADPSLATADRIRRGLEVLSNALQLDAASVQDWWDAAALDNGLTRQAVFEQLRQAFKVLLAIKTLHPGDSYQHAIEDLGVLLPGVVVADALAHAHFRSIRLLTGVLEDRVGAAL